MTVFDKVTGQDFFFSCPLTFHNHSSLLTFFLCFIVLFQSWWSHAQVFGKTLLHEFPIFNSHTEWNLLSSGTNALLWLRACYKTAKLQTNKQTSIRTCELRICDRRVDSVIESSLRDCRPVCTGRFTCLTSPDSVTPVKKLPHVSDLTATSKCLFHAA